MFDSTTLIKKNSRYFVDNISILLEFLNYIAWAHLQGTRIRQNAHFIYYNISKIYCIFEKNYSQIIFYANKVQM